MQEDAATPSFSILERIDMALALRLAQRADAVDLAMAVERGFELGGGDRGLDLRWIAATLELRGFAITFADVMAVLGGGPSRYAIQNQEHALVLGLHRVLGAMRECAGRGVAPDGELLQEWFQILTRDIPRFRNNWVRRDVPWDALPLLGYPKPAELPQILATFGPEQRYRDFPALFDRLHPVRRAFRVLWRFARVAPFPDLNLVMAWVAMNAYLLAQGYPLLLAEERDAEVLRHLAGGPPPTRVPAFEMRLLDAVVRPA
ncbi:MAG: hypothetical protein IT458_13700 [Planctomycetes bacterium]|nr:hypothetical protein [Planctomycetota bacterium]